MSQDAPNLTTIILGSGGLIGGLVTIGSNYVKFVRKKVVEPLEKENERLQSKNKDLEERLTGAKSDLDNFIRFLNKVETSELSLSSEDASTLRIIMSQVKRLQSMKEEEKAYKVAAQWLRRHQKSWVNDAVAATVSEYSNLRRRRIRSQFCKDIDNYVDWLYVSLNQYQHTNAPLNLFVKKPAVNYRFPYITAVRHIRDNADKKKLKMDESRILERFLEALIDKLDGEFRLN